MRRQLLIMGIILVLVLSGCGRSGGVVVVDAEAATQTVEARLPTLQAQIAPFNPDNAPTPNLAPGEARATTEAEAGDLDATQRAVQTQSANETPIDQNVISTQNVSGGGSSNPTPTAANSGSLGGSSGGGSGNYPEFDEHDTVLTETITSGETRSAEVGKAFDAHNWQIQASAGQTITIQVTAIGETDPEISLLDPNGAVLINHLDGGGRGAPESATYELPSSGVFTVRITVWHVGKYQLTVTLS